MICYVNGKESPMDAGKRTQNNVYAMVSSKFHRLPF